MLKKIVTGLLTTILLFVGGMQTTVDASADVNHLTDQLYQDYVSFSIHNRYLADTFADQITRHHHVPGTNASWGQTTNDNVDHLKQGLADQNTRQKPEKLVNSHVTDYSNQPQSNSDGEHYAQPDQHNVDDQQQADTKPKLNNLKREEQNGQKTMYDQISQKLGQFGQQVIKLTNDERTARGLDPLKICQALTEVARKKSSDMASNNYFSHDSPHYGSPFDMMKQFDMSYQTAGENIARGQKTPEEVVDGWMNSEGHRENILNPDFTHIGVGYVEEGHYWTQEFTGE